jgi:outer membrane protein
MRRKWVRALLSGAAISLAATMQTVSASADSLFGAMEKAYVTNPTLNSARAGQRATDASSFGVMGNETCPPRV